MAGSIPLFTRRRCLYNFRVRLKLAIVIALGSACACGFAQQTPSANAPQVRINYLNVCSPSDADQKEMAAALAAIPAKPTFSTDFEISRGRSTIAQPADETNPGGPEKSALAKWVRIRHELASGTFSNAQYSFSVDEKGMDETLVFRARDLTKSVLQVSLQDAVTTGTPATVLASNTPVDRIRIERNGKSSLVLARCAGSDQAKYEPLFRTGSDILARYRALLHVQQTVPGDLARVAGAGTHKKSTELKR